MPARRLDELRQQRQVEQGGLWIQQVREEAHCEQPAGRVGRQRAQLEGRRAAGPQRFPCQPSQVGGAGGAQHAVGDRYGKQHGGDPECSEQQIDDEPEADSSKRNQPGAATLGDRARHEIGHVGPRREDESECDQGEAGERGGVDQGELSWDGRCESWLDASQPYRVLVPPPSSAASATPASCRPRVTPARSAAERFWLTFHLPVSELSTISMPTIARSIVAR